MRVGLRLSIVLVPIVALVVMAAVPAAAAPTSDTTVTFAVQAGTLDITVPTAINLGSGSAGGIVSSPLGEVKVGDGRTAVNATWIASVVSTDFTTGEGTNAQTVPVANATYWSGPATATSGDGSFIPGQAGPAAAITLSTNNKTAFVHDGGTGNNTAAWNPTLQISLPLTALDGTYTGTVTHSVA